MSMLKTGFAASALIVSLGLITAPGVFAKGHGQGMSESPGQDVGDTTGTAQGLGAASSGNKGQGPGDTDAGDAPGNSGNPGGPGGDTGASDSPSQ